MAKEMVAATENCPRWLRCWTRGKITPAKALQSVNAYEYPAETELLVKIKRDDELVQALMAQLARSKATIIIGQTWFVEAGDRGIEVDTFNATVDGVAVETKITLREVEVEL